MIHKVSDHEKMSALDEHEGFERESMNQTAVDSFTKIVIASASEMIENGATLAQVANKFQLSPDFLGGLLKAHGRTKLACSCEQEEPQEYVPEMKKKAAVKNKNREMTEEEVDALDAYNSLHNKSASSQPILPNMSSKRILSSGGKGDGVTNIGGPRKQMGSERNNSIWDHEVIERQSQERTNDEILRANAAKTAKSREDAKQASRYQTIDGQDILEALKNTDQRKGSGVSSAYVQEAHDYNKKLPSKGISMFDTEEFERVPEKTAGEKRREEIKTAAAQPKDRSWVQSGSKSVTTNDIVDKFIDSLMNTKKKG